MEGDLAETHPRAASAVMTAVDKGAHLITIAHTATQMSRLASLRLPAMPGNEGEVIDGLLASVLDLGLEDWASVGSRCEGYDTLLGDLKTVKTTAEMLPGSGMDRARHAGDVLDSTDQWGGPPVTERGRRPCHPGRSHGTSGPAWFRADAASGAKQCARGL